MAALIISSVLMVLPATESRAEETTNVSVCYPYVNLYSYIEKDAGFTVVDITDEYAIPVYRLYNKNDGGMHFYTNSSNEAKMLQSLGWIYEGISHYVYQADSGVGVPQYRLYNPGSSNGEHNWTSNLVEYNMLIDKGWKDEGVCWNLAE